MMNKSRRDSLVTTGDEAAEATAPPSPPADAKKRAAAARGAILDLSTHLLQEANAYIERGDPQSALALVEVWGIQGHYGFTHGWDPMPETDAGRLLRILAAQIDLRVQQSALAVCIDAVRFGSWPASLRPQLAEAALEACAAPLVCLLPHRRGTEIELLPFNAANRRWLAYYLLYVLRDANGRKVLEQAATEDPEERCREAAERYLSEW